MHLSFSYGGHSYMCGTGSIHYIRGSWFQTSFSVTWCHQIIYRLVSCFVQQITHQTKTINSFWKNSFVKKKRKIKGCKKMSLYNQSLFIRCSLDLVAIDLNPISHRIQVAVIESAGMVFSKPLHIRFKSHPKELPRRYCTW